MENFKFGLESLIENTELVEYLKTKKVSLVAHPASVDQHLKHSVDFLIEHKIPIVSCYGPQHGMRGEKQDNMMESEDYLDPIYQIPVYSLYGQSRRPTVDSMKLFDVCLFDLQDVGTRIYTFLTTLLYMMEACHQHKKELWILDRPNPAGRSIEGLTLEKGWESFVGAAAVPMRHGLTLGEMAKWMAAHFHLNINLKIIAMKGYSFLHPWPQGVSWVNPSPNASNVSMSRCFPGSVMLEGTMLSEGRGTTRPLEVLGAPDIDGSKILKKMQDLEPNWMKGCLLRSCYFEPTFHKHQKQLCSGFQVHVDNQFYQEKLFKPFRLFSLAFKAIRLLYPEYNLWRDFPYEYVFDKLAIDVINGGTKLRDWVDLESLKPKDLDAICLKNESDWQSNCRDFLIYK